MTTIAWDGHTLAADRLVVDGSTRCGLVTKILRTPDGRLLGASGGLGWQAVLRHLADVGERPRAWPAAVRILEVLQDRTVRCHEDGGAIDLPPGPQVIGSGGDFALAAMMAGKTAAEAVEIAIRLDVRSGGPIDVLTIPWEDRC